MCLLVEVFPTKGSPTHTSNRSIHHNTCNIYHSYYIMQVMFDKLEKISCFCASMFCLITSVYIINATEWKLNLLSGVGVLLAAIHLALFGTLLTKWRNLTKDEDDLDLPF